MSKENKYIWAAASDTGRDSLTVKAMDWSQDECIKAKCVLLMQSAGSLNFQFSMTQEQARQMAMALIAAAESLA